MAPPDLFRRFRSAEGWFSRSGGLVTRSKLADDHYISLTMPDGSSSSFVLRDEEDGDYEREFVAAVEALRERSLPYFVGAPRGER